MSFSENFWEKIRVVFSEAAIRALTLLKNETLPATGGVL